MNTDSELRIMVTDKDGTLLDTVYCTVAELFHDVRRNPDSLLAGVSLPAAEEAAQ